MAAINWTFLTEEQIWNDFLAPSGTLQFCRATDAAKAMGAYLGAETGTCTWLTSSKGERETVVSVFANGEKHYSFPNLRSSAARPAALFSEVLSAFPKGTLGKEEGGARIFTCDLAYMQNCVEPDSHLEKNLNNLEKSNRLAETKAGYTVNTAPVRLADGVISQAVQLEKLKEYELSGRRFVKMQALVCDNRADQYRFSSGVKIEEGRSYWMEVLPITFFIIQDTFGIDWAVSKEALYAGIPMESSHIYNGNFENSYGGKFLHEYFAVEIMPPVQNPKAGAKKSSITIRSGASIEEDMRDNFEDGCSMLLYGPSGVGKSMRVYEIDPNFTSIVLKNGMMHEEIIGGKEPGSSLLQPPNWYTIICEKCGREPDKNHILFIDEITNARDTVQNLVFDIILNRSVRPNLWHLPPNVVIIAAGNSREESSAAYNMPEPLFRRFNAVIGVPLDIQSWVDWGYEPDTNGRTKVHPLVSAFVVGNPEVLYSKYDEEKLNQQPTLDPRKWVMVSNVLYKAELRGNISRNRIAGMVGKDVAASFCEFISRPKVSVEDIKNNDYGHVAIENLSDKMFVLGCLLHTGKEDEELVKAYIKSHLGDEMLTLFNFVALGREG